LPPGKTFEFILEREKLDNIKKVIAHNQGEILEEKFVGSDVQMKVRKVPAE